MRLIVGLGGNRGKETLQAFRWVLSSSELPWKVLRVSSLWLSRSLLPGQEDYWNAAALAELKDDPWSMLAKTKAVELRFGRNPDAPRWSPRVLDIDLLICDHMVVFSPELVIPHPELTKRCFAAIPASELAPTWVHPTSGETLSEIAAKLEKEGQGCTKHADIGWHEQPNVL